MSQVPTANYPKMKRSYGHGRPSKHRRHAQISRKNPRAKSPGTVQSGAEIGKAVSRHSTNQIAPTFSLFLPAHAVVPPSLSRATSTPLNVRHFPMPSETLKTQFDARPQSGKKLPITQRRMKLHITDSATRATQPHAPASPLFERVSATWAREACRFGASPGFSGPL